MAGSVNFWQGMDKATDVSGADKMMIGKNANGEVQYIDFQQANQYLSIQGIEIKPVAAGALPAGPTGQERKMVIESAGTWTYGGNNFVNPSGEIMTLWWNGTTWSVGSRAVLPVPQGVPVINPIGSGLPTEKATADYVKPIEKKIDDITIDGKNLADKSKIVFGSWSNTGVFSINANRLGIIINVEKDKDYVISGLGATSNVTARLTFFTTAGAFSSNVMGTGGSENVTFKAPITGTVAIYIVNATGLGDDPTNNLYANRLQVELGTVATAYEEFKKVLKLPSDLAKKEDVDPLKAITEPSKNLIDKSKIVAGQFSATGGFTTNINRLAIKVEGLESTTYTLSGMGALASNQVAIVIPLRAGGISRSINGDSTTTPRVITLTALEGPHIFLNLANVANIGTNPTDNAIANAVMLEKGSVATDYQSYGLKIPAKNVTGVSIETKYDVYVDFHPTAYQGRERLIIYTRRAQTDYYVGHIINHELDTSEIVYSNQFRITRANEYKLVNGQMIFIAADVIFGGESECVYRNTADKADFTGGVHGDEQMISFDYYIDGVRQDKTIATGLVACKTAWYTQKSSMHETASTAGVVAEGHPIEAYHYKKTIFTGNGYETHNELEWVKVISFYWYYGICCVGRYNATEAMNERLVIAPLLGTTNTFFDLSKQNAEQQGAANGWTQEYIRQRTTLPNSNTFEYNSSATKKGLTMKAFLFSDYLTLLQAFIHDRANDGKGYYQTLTVLSQLGKRDRSVMEIIYR